MTTTTLGNSGTRKAGWAQHSEAGGAKLVHLKPSVGPPPELYKLWKVLSDKIAYFTVEPIKLGRARASRCDREMKVRFGLSAPMMPVTRFAQHNELRIAQVVVPGFIHHMTTDLSKPCELGDVNSKDSKVVGAALCPNS